MKFLKTRVLSLFLAVIVSVSVLVVPASANASFPDHMRDYESVDDWNARLLGTASTTLNALADKFGWSATVEGVFWGLVNMRMSNDLGQVEYSRLCQLAELFNQNFNVPVQESFFLQSIAGGVEIANDTLAFLTLGTLSPSFTVTYSASDECYRIIEEKTGIFVVDSAGRYPYALDIAEDGQMIGNKWIGETTAADRASREVATYTLDQLNMLVQNLKKEGIPAQIKSLSNNYKCVWWNRQVLADSTGVPILCWIDDKTATNEERPDAEVTVNGENVDVIEGNQTNLNLDNMTMLLPDGTIQFIDKIIYDESTKSYHIDSHDTYNYEINNYYTWNYYINYTSITYIGQTEEYNKYYEVYYELPDGRSSADLTKEDLEQLNLSVDVIPYGRSADDTSLRSLYHFDGDTKDSSYWNYCTDFTWNKGASLTYMDAGVFEGALYLDETEHDFTIVLPSGVSTHDFTLQFRYYQSATIAPQTDSYVQVGGSTVLQLNGGSFLSPDGLAYSVTPVGSWNEIAIIRESGIVYIYLNGVCIGNFSNTSAMNNLVNFHFGSQQQTFKYFDELRFLNFALVSSGSSYTPTSVPYDTNLSLVLPDSVAPVADEYWDWDTSIEPMWSGDLTSGYPDFLADGNPPSVLTGVQFRSYSGYSSITPVLGSASFSTSGRAVTGTTYNTKNYRYGIWVPIYCYYQSRSSDFTGASNSSNMTSINNKVLTFSLVGSDCEVYSLTFTACANSVIATNNYYNKVIASATFDWGGLYYISTGLNGKEITGIFIQPNSGVPVDFIYSEIVEGDTPNTNHEFVNSVTLMDKSDLNTPTLAARTDIDITSYQIGGVRPSLPVKGLVWAMVENERITSLQVYNGQAWEGVDGRIWTGERWIPMSSYNIITLQDLYDIVDATPNYEYIYSEAGFWSWWQKSWNAFTEKLFATLGAGGAAGGTLINPDKLPSVPDDESTAEDDGWSFVELLVVLKDGTWNVITGVVSTAYDGFSGFVQAVSDSGGFFDYYDPDNEQSIFFIPLEEGASVWD